MEDKIQAWLEKTGYPLELFVHKVLLSRGYMSEKSPMYSDIESGTAREVDVTAYKFGPEFDEYSYDLKMLFECKKSDKPLLVLCNGFSKSARFEHSMNHEGWARGAYANILGHVHLNKMSSDSLVEAIGRFSEQVLVGYSIVQAFTGSDENIYKGIMGLAKANEYYRSQYNEFFQSARDYGHSNLVDANPFLLQLPVLVVDCPLYMVFINEAGETRLESTDWASLSIHMPWVFGKSDEYGCNIQIIHKNSLEEFLGYVEKFHHYISQPEIVSPAVKREVREAFKIKDLLKRFSSVFG